MTRPARWGLTAIILAIALLCGLCAATSPVAVAARRTALLMPAFFAAGPSISRAWPAASIEQIDTALGDGYPGVTLHTYRPANGRYPALVISLGVDPAPRDDPRVTHLVAGLAAAGIVAILVESEALDAGRIQSDSSDALVAAFANTEEQPFVDRSRIGFLGFSVGGSLALIAAANPRIAGRVRIVEAVGAYGSLASLARATLSHTIDVEGRLETWDPDPLTVSAVRFNLIQSLAPATDQPALEAAFADGSAAGSAPDSLSPQGRAVWRLLAAADAAEFDSVLAGLEPSQVAALQALSPTSYLASLRAPTYLIVDKGDPLIPYVESLAMAAELRQSGDSVYLSEFDILRHVTPEHFGSPPLVARDLLRLLLHVGAVLQRL